MAYDQRVHSLDLVTLNRIKWMLFFEKTKFDFSVEFFEINLPERC